VPGYRYVETRDGREPERSKNEPNNNPGFAKNKSELKPNPKVKIYKNPNPTQPYKEPNRTRICYGYLCGSFTE